MSVDEPTSSDGRKRLIAVIGIDAYQDLPVLHNAVSDAKGIRDMFVKRFGFKEFMPPLLNEAATQAAITRLVEDQLRKALCPEDELILFFAGHGRARRERIGKESKEKVTGFIAPVDAKKEEWTSYIKIRNLVDSVDGLKARCILIVLDACNSGLEVEDVLYLARSDAAAYSEAHRTVGRKMLTSSLKSQVARDNGPIPNHSLFTGMMLRGLLDPKVDTDGNGLISLRELAFYVQQHVEMESSGAQTPGFGSFGHDRGGEIYVELEESQREDSDPAKSDHDVGDPEPTTSNDDAEGPEALAVSADAASSGHSTADEPEHANTASWRGKALVGAGLAAVLAAAVGWPREDSQPPVDPSGPKTAGDEAATSEEPDEPASFSIGVDLSTAKGGLWVAIVADDDTKSTAHGALCEAFESRPRRRWPVLCTVVEPTSTEQLVRDADRAQLKVVMQVDRDRNLHVHATSHHRSELLLATLNGLPLPTDPTKLWQVTTVLESVVGSVRADRVEFPVFELGDVDPRWMALAEWQRNNQGHNEEDDLNRRKELLDEFELNGEDPFYRDLVALTWAYSETCVIARSRLRELISPGHHDGLVRPSAMLRLAACLVDGEPEDASDVDEAARLLGAAFGLSSHRCTQAGAIGTMSIIDRLRGDDALWLEHFGRWSDPDQRELDPECGPTVWSHGFSVRGAQLGARQRWCDAADAYMLAYSAHRSDRDSLFNWGEYAGICHQEEQRTPSKDVIYALKRLTTQLSKDVGTDETQRQAVSLAYLRWCLTRSEADAQVVMDAYERVPVGLRPLLEGVATELESAVCEGAPPARCSRRILAQAKRTGDTEALRGSLGLR